jgi:TonB-dependent receptor
MREMTTGPIRPNRLSLAVSLALASLVAGNAALAQDTQATVQDQPAAVKEKNGEMHTLQVLVVGTRLSQQSSIDRKKNAATAIDSIVAEDVGSLPDRNVGEAISRMAGIAVDRGDYGEGIGVSVRGNGADLTRVELDGQAVSSAGGTDMNGGGDGRGTEFRQLSADLIKSVDVVKGSTADMTEGSLGGGIIIKTRTGLDFKKPFASLRLSGTQSNLNKKWEPDANLILSNKFLDGRLGLLLNASSITLDNESHQFHTVVNGQNGYSRLLDFDNSPEKTFSFRPDTLDMDNPASTLPDGVFGTWKGNTPQELLTKAAAAKTKADCTAPGFFPTLTATDLAGLSSKNRDGAISTRNNEQLTCLNQWNDYTPTMNRYILKRQIDKRENLDLRADFKVNSELSVYAKGSYSRRKVDDNFVTFGLGGFGINDAGSYTDTANVRSPVPGSGYYLYPDQMNWGKTGLIKGSVSTIDPSSVVVDANHHVTQFKFNNGGTNTDQIHNEMGTDTRYLQLGGEFKRGGFKAEFMFGDSESKFYRADKRASFGSPYDYATATLQPDGLWTYAFPPDYKLDDPSNYTTLVTPKDPKQPLRTANQPIATWAPQLRETSERTAKLDLTYALPSSVPFFERIKAGFNLRDTGSDSWTPGRSGWTVQSAQGSTPAIYMPTQYLRSTIVGCQDTAGSLATGGTPCQYGWFPSTSATTALQGQSVVPMSVFQEMVSASMTQNATPTRFFNGAKDRPAELLDNWRQLDIEKVWAIGGVPNANFDCMKSCTASDGKVYEQPVSRVRERTEALYLMSDFSLDHIPFTQRALPFGWQLTGNVGYRYIRNRVQGTGSQTFVSILETDKYDPLNRDAPEGIVTTTYTKNTTIEAVTHDFLPVYNLAMWVVPDQVVVRYNRAKTVARPPVSRLLANGSCTYDQRNLDSGADVDMTCNTMGNPALKGQMNLNQNLSIEYYPNKDTMFSASAYKQKGLVGPNTTQLVSAPVFAGSNVVNPATGQALGDIIFDYRTYIDGLPRDRTGVEFSSKTAFTFLPWKLRFTGLDANFTRQHSSTTDRPAVDLITGEPLPPSGEPKYSYNLALWYDDGKFAARLALQAVAKKYSCYAPCSGSSSANGGTGNTYPAVGIFNRTALAWNPNSPNWTDATRYIDGKVSYKFSPSVEFFVEGRNLGNATVRSEQGPGVDYANGAPMLNSYFYPGRRITVGVNLRN